MIHFNNGPEVFELVWLYGKANTRDTVRPIWTTYTYMVIFRWNSQKTTHWTFNKHYIIQLGLIAEIRFKTDEFHRQVDDAWCFVKNIP